MVIDADGLFNGARWRKCSNPARLNAPFLLLASNGYARLEVDPVRIVARAYASFDPRPAAEDILGWIGEYAAANLIFLYDAGGSTWGAWDTPDRLLAKYKTAADKRSPAPPEPAFSEWRSRYRAEEKTVATFPKSFENVSEKLSENFSLGIGIGDGIGKGKNICASDEARVDGSDSFSLVEPKGKQPDQRDAWFSEFWEAYKPIRSRARKAALKAFTKIVRSEAMFQAVMAGPQQQKLDLLSRSPEHRPFCSSWLNGERYEDEAAEVDCTRRAENRSPADRAAEAALKKGNPKIW